MGQIFLSYANEERALAGKFAGVLEEIGWTVWWERRIPEGRRYREVIQERLTGSDCVIVLWTPASGEATYVRNEAQEGRRQGNLIQVWLRHGVVPLEFRHLPVRDLRSWPTRASDPALEQLVREIARLAGPPAPRPEPQPEPELEWPEDLELVEDTEEVAVTGGALALTFWIVATLVLGAWPAILSPLELLEDSAWPTAAWVNALGVIPLVTTAMAAILPLPGRGTGVFFPLAAHLANAGVLFYAYGEAAWQELARLAWIAPVWLVNVILVVVVSYTMRERRLERSREEA